MKITTLIGICLFLTSCFINQPDMVLPGKIVITSIDNSCSFFDNSNLSKGQFKLRNEDDVSYGGLSWANQTDRFVGIEYLQSKGKGVVQANVVCIDLKGDIVDKIHVSGFGEIANNAFLSRTDKVLLFTVHKKEDTRLNPFEGLIPMQSLIVMNYSNKKIILRIDSIGRTPNFQLYESPWVYNERQFVYSVRTVNKVVVKRDTLNTDREPEGVFVFDIISGKKRLLIPNAHFAIASPIASKIAYIKDRSIGIYDFENKTTRIIYEPDLKEEVTSIHWTPDGKYIYFVHINHTVGEHFVSGEKLIDVSSGQEVLFKKIHQGFQQYTWK